MRISGTVTGTKRLKNRCSACQGTTTDLGHPLHTSVSASRVETNASSFEVGEQAVNGLWTGCELTKSPNLKIIQNMLASYGKHPCRSKRVPSAEQVWSKEANVCKCALYTSFIASRFLEACESCFPSCQSAIRIPGCQLVKATSINGPSTSSWEIIENHRKQGLAGGIWWCHVVPLRKPAVEQRCGHSVPG